MANLLERSSLVLTPTAYNNGEALCIKPDDGSGDFDFSRNSAATRVNAQGLVENVQILSSNLVQNGDFSEEGVQEVSNGSFSQEGSELIVNGNFATDSNWGKQTSNWTIANGYAVCDGLQTSNSSLFQDFAVVNGVSYKIDFTITDSVNNLNLILGATTIGQYGDGTHTVYVEKDSGGPRIFFQATASNAFQGSIDNVSVREVGQDWVLSGSGWSIGEDKIVSVNGSSYGVYQLNALVSGKTYKITYEVKDYVSGQFGIRANTIGGITAAANGVYTDYLTSNGDKVYLMGFGAFNGSVTNISVKEVGQNWQLGTGWSIGEDKAISDTTASNLTPSTTLISGEKYKFTLDVAKISAGSFTFLLRFNGTNTTFATINTEGSFTFYATADATGFRLQNLSGGTTDFSVTNITAVQITDNTNLPRINYENGCGSWLFEPQSTNLITQSELFSDASWANVGLTINNNASVSPEGVFNATKIIATTANSRHELKTNLATGNGTDMVSCFVKKSGYNYVQIASWANPSNYVNFDLANGSVGSIGTTPPTNYGIKDYGNGWYRIYANVQASGGGIVGIGIVTSASSGWAQSFIGNGIDGIEIWGAQVEQQSYATSYIPTNGSTVTRNQDVCNNGATGTGLINSTEGVLYWEGAKLQAASGTQVIGLSDGGTANRISFQTTTTANQIMFVVDAGGQQASESFIVSDITDYNKFALKWKQDDFSFWINGIKVGTDTSGNVPPLNALNTLHFYYGTGLFNFFGKTKALAVWKEALSDSELQSLTTI